MIGVIDFRKVAIGDFKRAVIALGEKGVPFERVDIDLDRIAQILVDQHRGVARHLHGGGDIFFELRLAVDEGHIQPRRLASFQRLAEEQETR